MASWAPSLMPSPSAAWPPLSGLWVAILIVPLLPWAARFDAPGSATRVNAAKSVSVRRTGLRIIGPSFVIESAWSVRPALYRPRPTGQVARRADRPEKTPRGAGRIGRAAHARGSGAAVAAAADHRA